MKLKFSNVFFSLVLAAGVLSGCASNDEDKDSIPVERPIFENQISTKVIWSKSVGDGVGQFYSRLAPVSGYNLIFAADRVGLISAFETDSGKNKWSADIRAPEQSWLGWFGLNLSPDVRVSGMVASYEKLFVGCENGYVVALNVTDGTEIWRTKVDGEALSNPIAEEGKVIVNLGSGHTVALDSTDGKVIWNSLSEVPSLTLRGVSSPAYTQGGVFVGSSNGKIITYVAANGQLAWDVAIAKPQGVSELSRIVDVDSTPIISGLNIYALSAGGSLVSVDLRSGRVNWKREYKGYQNMVLDGSTLYLSDSHSVVYAVDARTGVEMWSNTSLRNRHITAAELQSGYLVVGDFEGYLYWLDKTNGEFKSSKRLDSDWLLAKPLVVNNKLIQQTRSGTVYALEINAD